MNKWLKKVPPPVWYVLAAVIIYLVYRWYKNRQSASTTAGGLTLGTNLNSVAPDLSAGATGPNSGFDYLGGNTTISISAPVTNPAPVPVSHLPSPTPRPIIPAGFKPKLPPKNVPPLA